VRRKQEYFCKRDWTTQITLIPRENFSSRRMLEAWDGLPESAVTSMTDVLLHSSETTRCSNFGLDGRRRINPIELSPCDPASEEHQTCGNRLRGRSRRHGAANGSTRSDGGDEHELDEVRFSRDPDRKRRSQPDPDRNNLTAA
jgi:hypothetical protein